MNVGNLEFDPITKRYSAEKSEMFPDQSNIPEEIFVKDITFRFDYHLYDDNNYDHIAWIYRSDDARGIQLVIYE